MKTIDVMTTDGDLVTVSTKEIANGLSDELIMSQFDRKEFAYLSALALEAMENEQYDIDRALAEFIRNEETTSDSWIDRGVVQ